MTAAKGNNAHTYTDIHVYGMLCIHMLTWPLCIVCAPQTNRSQLQSTFNGVHCAPVDTFCWLQCTQGMLNVNVAVCIGWPCLSLIFCIVKPKEQQQQQQNYTSELSNERAQNGSKSDTYYQ